MSQETINSQILANLHVLCAPIEEGPRHFEMVDKKLAFKTIKKQGLVPYQLVVVDEAHHLYSNEHSRALVERYAQGAERLLLADVSQSHGRKIEWPKDTSPVQLTKVVRCSQRIVAGAMAFQLDGADGKSKKTDTSSQHKATGPPLKSFLFDIPAGTDRLDCYVERTIRAIHYIMDEYPGLVLHNRLAILVPNEYLRDELKERIRQPLKDIKQGKQFELISAKDAACTIHRTRGHETTENLVLDTVANFDGLERLIVIGVDLDLVIQNPGTDTHASRSLLYRALTRAHMVVAIVNELLHGGWLEFLMGVQIESGKFEAEGEEAPGPQCCSTNAGHCLAKSAGCS